MPDKPLWLDRIPETIRLLAESAEPWVDRPLLESLLGVGRRRAQQLLAAMPGHSVGTSSVARREDVIEYLRRVAEGQTAYYEGRRKRRLWSEIARDRERWTERPPLLVEVRETERRRIELLDFEGLPEGVELAPGRISVSFASPEEALRKLMALALAISRNREAFDRLVTPPAG